MIKGKIWVFKTLDYRSIHLLLLSDICIWWSKVLILLTSPWHITIWILCGIRDSAFYTEGVSTISAPVKLCSVSAPCVSENEKKGRSRGWTVSMAAQLCYLSFLVYVANRKCSCPSSWVCIFSQLKCSFSPECTFPYWRFFSSCPLWQQRTPEERGQELPGVEAESATSWSGSSTIS